MIFQVLLSMMMLLLVGIQGVPQGPGYLPPAAGAPAATAPRPQQHYGHPDEWAGDPVNYEFSYEVQDAQAGLDYGHHEMRKDDEATGGYHVLLPDGRTQYVDYIADQNGYRPVIRYEGTATYPAASPGHSEGYKYRKK